MDIEKIYLKLKSITSNIKRDEMLSEHTTFRTGGPADIFLEPASVSELRELMTVIREEGIPYFVLGNGSNLLVKDGGFRGAVIYIGRQMGGVDADPETCIVNAGAGALLSETAREAASASLTGLEFASGIPGSLGGGVFMNAGAYGGELSQVIISADALMPDGLVRTFSGEELDMAYRHSVFYENGGIILSASFRLEKGDPQTINDTMKDLNRRRVEKQPLNYPSAGSTFKRPEGYFAGKLIEDAGCKGLTAGGAMVSPKHAGFVVNKGGASAKDILDLIKLVQMRVRDEFSVDLETEVRIIGED